MGGFFGIGLNFIFGTLLSANGNFKELNNLAGIAVVFNIGMNLYMAPAHGSEGIAISFFITQMGVAVAQIFLAKQKIGFQFVPKFILIHLTLLVILLIIGVLFQKSEFLLILQLTSGGALLLVLKIVNIKDLKLMFLPSKETKNNISA
jgi:O-antigen/teichoic acid export membrane protein